MKKITLVLAVLVLAVPVMAVHTNVTATATQVGATDEFDIIVTWSGGGSPPRAFAIDVNVGGGQTITEVSGYHTGDSNASGKGFGIFPASFARVINADFNNFDDANYTPVAHPCDLPGDTLGGLNTSGVTLELGSLYVGAPNKPTSPSTLARLKVSGSCTMCIATNVGRGKIVLEDGNEPNALSAPCTALTFCSVPNVVGDTNAVAQAAISVDFTIGTITSNCSDTIADGNVISTDPAAGAFPGCGNPVDIVVSKGPPPTVPNVLDMNEADAIAAINAVANLSVGNVTYECNDVEAAGEVLSQTPTAGPASCDATVDLVVSDGSPTVPNVVGDVNGDAQAAINAVSGLSVGTVTTTYTDCSQDVGEVVSQNPVAGAATCGTTVDIVVRGPACGDLDCDGKMRFADWTALAGLLNNYGEPDPPPRGPITILSDSPYWNPMADVDGDGKMRFADWTAIAGLLNNYGLPDPPPRGPITIIAPHAYGSCP